MSMTYLLTYLISFLTAAGLLAAVFVIAHRLSRYDLVDSVWGLAFIAVATSSILAGAGGAEVIVPAMVATILTGAWGLRLSLHIFSRWRRSAHEDARYTELRRRWRGSTGHHAFWRIFMLQAVLASIIVWPVVHLNMASSYGSGWWLWSGAVLWAVGFIVEVVSDRQLSAFTRAPEHKGQLMTEGLWRYSRHPNYFGELVQWWGIYVIALGAPYGWVTAVGPLLLSYLIIFVSGIPPSERRASRRPGWAAYRRRTSRLLPVPPKKV